MTPDLEKYSVAMNFSWLEGARLAGCRGPRSDADLSFLSAVGVRALVRLASDEETGICRDDVDRHGIQDCYEPVTDFTPPGQDQIDRVVRFVTRSLAEQ